MSGHEFVDSQALATWREMRDLTVDLSELALSDIEAADFYRELTGRVHAALDAFAAAVWTLAPDGGLELAAQIDLQTIGLNERPPGQRTHPALLETVLRSGEPALFHVQGESDADGENGNPRVHLLAVAPLMKDRQAMGIVEAVLSQRSRPDAQRGYLSFLSQVCRLAVDYEKNREIQRLRDRVSQFENVEDFSRKIHRSQTLRGTAYEIANEGRLFVGCDRLSVATRRGRKCRIQAVSGLDSVSRRSNMIRRLERLVTLVVRTGEPLLYTGSFDDLPPPIEDALSSYVDETHCRLLAIVPMQVDSDGQSDASRASSVLGALVVEDFQHEGRDTDRNDRIRRLVDNSTIALKNARDWERLFLLPVWRALGTVSRTVGERAALKWILIVAAISAITVAAIAVPADFELEAPGKLLPTVRRDVFSRIEGVVSEIHVEHGDVVSAGDLLAVLRSSQLDYESTAIQGELQTVITRLAAIRAARVANLLTTPTQRGPREQEAIEEQELLQRQRGLEEQIRTLAERQDLTAVRSPIDGRVTTWNVSQRLAARPVAKGDSLLSVAALDGPWELELAMPEDRMGHIVAAQKELGENLMVEFVLATDPTTTHHGKVTAVALAAELTADQENVVTITVVFDKQSIGDLRPRASVRAKVYCGRRSIGYVWLHDLFEFFQRRVLFKL